LAGTVVVCAGSINVRSTPKLGCKYDSGLELAIITDFCRQSIHNTRFNLAVTRDVFCKFT
jgi:hypothetical protein